MAKNIFDKLVEEVDKIDETSSQQNVSTEPVKKATKSITGFGVPSKLSMTPSEYLEYLKNKEGSPFLTITTRTTLTDQHEKSFKNINLKD
jgi:hypothetical protein